jgi:hypothetical protein
VRKPASIAARPHARPTRGSPSALPTSDHLTPPPTLREAASRSARPAWAVGRALRKRVGGGRRRRRRVSGVEQAHEERRIRLPFCVFSKGFLNMFRKVICRGRKKAKKKARPPFQTFSARHLYLFKHVRKSTYTSLNIFRKVHVPFLATISNMFRKVPVHL